MKFLGSLRVFGSPLEDLPSILTENLPGRPSTLLRTLGWLSAGAGALGLGLVVGRELRRRYKFHRLTPYDLYAHAGDYNGDIDFGVGI